MKRGTRAEGRRVTAQEPLASRRRGPRLRLLVLTEREVEVALVMLKGIPWLPTDGYDEILSVIRKLRRAK